MSSLVVPVPKLGGEFEIRIRNAESLEIEKIIKSKNIFTRCGLHQVFRSPRPFEDLSDSAYRIIMKEGVVKETPVITEPFAGIRVNGNEDNTARTDPSDDLVDDWNYVDTVFPHYSYIEDRFGQPSTTKNYNTILVFNNTDKIIAYTNLDIPCTQTPTQVLDVLYRLFFIFPTDLGLDNDDGVSVSPRSYEWLMKYSQTNATKGENGTVRGHHRYLLPQLPTGSDTPDLNSIRPMHHPFHKLPRQIESPYNFFVMEHADATREPGQSIDDAAETTTVYEQFSLEGRWRGTWTYDFTTGQSDFVGLIMGSSSLTRNDLGTIGANGESNASQDQWDPDITEYFIMKHWHMVPAVQRIRDTSNNIITSPIQPIHNHGPTAFTPFIDVNELADSAGVPIANGTTWTDPDFPKFYRFDYHTSGDVGTGTYTFRVRDTIGFIDRWDSASPRLGTYLPNARWDPYIYRSVDNGLKQVRDVTASAMSTTIPPAGNNFTTILYGHHGTYDRTEEYDLYHTIFVDDTGITLLHNWSHDYYNFDINSTPSLNVSDIRQVAASSNGEIWIAEGSAGGGIYVIHDPTGTSPTITKQSTGLPSSGDIACYGIQVHNDGEVFAMINGGLYRSSAEATMDRTWSSTSFDFVGADANTASGAWSATVGLVLDPEHVNYHLLIRTNTLITSGAGERRETWWRDDADNPSGIRGPILQPHRPNLTGGNAPENHVTFNLNLYHHQYVRVSRTGGFWVSSDGGNEDSGQDPYETQTLYRLTYGSADKFAIDSDVPNESTYNSSLEHKYPDRVSFIYDNYNVPYVIGNGLSNTPKKKGIWDINGNCVGGGYIQHPSWNDGAQEQIELYPEGLNTDGKRGNGVFFLGGINFGGNDPYWPRYINQIFPSPWDGSNYAFNDTASPYWYGDLTTAQKIDMALNNEHTIFQEGIWRDYRWNGSAWVLNWANNTIDTGNSAQRDSTGIAASRHGFDVESHEFNGRACINATAVFDSASYNGDYPFANDLTLAFKVNWTDAYKRYHALTGGSDYMTEPNIGPFYQEKGECLFEINDPAGNNRIALLWNSPYFPDSNDHIYLLESTTITKWEPKPSANVLIHFTANTTEYALYLDGVLANTIAPNSAVSFANSSLKFTVGATNYNTEYNNHDRPSMFYAGELGDIQVWSRVLTSTMITEAYNNRATTTLPNGATSNTELEARWELDQQTGLSESRATHDTWETLHDGIEVMFDDGTEGTTGVSVGSYHTMAVVDGIMIDNSMTFDHSMEMYFYPTDINFDYVEAANGYNSVPSSAIQVIDQPVYWTQGSDNNRGGEATGVNSIQHFYDNVSGYTVAPGAVANAPEPNLATTSSIQSIQYLTGNFTIKFKVVRDMQETSANDDCALGIYGTFVTTGNEDKNSLTHSLVFNTDGFVDIFEGSTRRVANWQAYSPGDEFEISRTGTTINFHKVGVANTNGTDTSSGGVYVTYSADYQEFAIYDCKVTYDQPAYVMNVGNNAVGSANGCWDENFLTCSWSEFATEVVLDGNVIDVTIEQTGFGEATSPAANTCVFLPEAGLLCFNSADADKTVTGRFAVITR